MHMFNMDLNDQMDYIIDLPEHHQVPQPTPPSLPHVDSYNLGVTPSMPFAPFAPFVGTSSSGRSKRKSLMVDIVDYRFSSLTT